MKYLKASLLSLMFFSSCSNKVIPEQKNSKIEISHSSETTAKSKTKTPFIKLELKKMSKLQDGSPIRLVSITTEEIAEDPDVPEDKPVGADVSIEIMLGNITKEISLLSTGNKNIIWGSVFHEKSDMKIKDLFKVSEGFVFPYRIRFKALVEGRNEVELEVHRLDHVLELVHKNTRVKRGKRISFGDFAMRFDRHSDKKTEDSEPSPIFTEVTFFKNSEIIDSVIKSDDDKNIGWMWRDYHFKVLDYKYNDYVILQITQLGKSPMRLAD